MGTNDRQEFIIMLLIENRSIHQSDGERNFYNYLEDNYDIDKFNERYMELLDEFMKPYALNNAEKSEKNL